VSSEIETDRFLLLYEEVEKTLVDRLGLPLTCMLTRLRYAPNRPQCEPLA
jgi:hypothetical protein